VAGTITSYDTVAGRRYRVRYRKPDKSQTDKRGFRTKKEAELFLASVTVSKATGDYIDPALARVTVADLAETWLAGKRPPTLKPSSFKPLLTSWNVHVEPTWGHREIRSILPSEVQGWVTRLGQPVISGGGDKSATVVLRALGVLAGILDMAIADRRISRNPARSLTNLPRKSRKVGRAYLTHDQLQTLAEKSAHPALVLTLGYCGLCWGEATALRVRNVNQLRRRLHIEENAVLVGSDIHVGTPKTWEQRSVPFPAFLSPMLAELCQGKGPNDLVFGKGRTHMKRGDYITGWFATAVRRVQSLDETMPRVTPHDLRHTAASFAVSAGANVKAVQKMLGHASASMTLDTYTDLFDDDLDSVSNRMEKAVRLASVGKTWAKRLA
jgi:integrase